MSISISPEVIIKSRVRLARNIVDYPFAPVLDDACRKEIVEKIGNSLADSDYERIDNNKSKLLFAKLSEENKVSREFAADDERHSLFYNDNAEVYIMVCEEDHLRFQAFSDGLNIFDAGKKILEVEKKIGNNIKYAYDNELGFLTHCPTNLGTALRASVMMHLPALTLTNRIGEVKSQLEKIGVTIRGIYGEGSSAEAFIYQISNSLSLGISENDIFRKIETIAERVANDELDARASLLNTAPENLTDKIMRSVGTLKYAHILSTKEFFECYAYSRLGVSLKIVNEISIKSLDTLLYKAMPAHIIFNAPDAASDTLKRDVLRAKIVKKEFKEESC